MPFAMTTGRAGIFYRVRGSGEPLVLLSGQANTHHWWDSAHADFDGAHRAVVLDYLGTGESDKPRGAEYSPRRFAADVIAVLGDLGVARAHVYGTSLGARWRRGWPPTTPIGSVRSCSGAPRQLGTRRSRPIPPSSGRGRSRQTSPGRR